MQFSVRLAICQRSLPHQNLLKGKKWPKKILNEIIDETRFRLGLEPRISPFSITLENGATAQPLIGLFGFICGFQREREGKQSTKDFAVWENPAETSTIEHIGVFTSFYRKTQLDSVSDLNSF